MATVLQSKRRNCRERHKQFNTFKIEILVLHNNYAKISQEKRTRMIGAQIPAHNHMLVRTLSSYKYSVIQGVSERKKATR